MRVTANPVLQLDTYGPDHCEVLDVDAARRLCRDLAFGHYENFSVLSSLVPRRLRDDFAAIYAFCRWSDDLGDEIGVPTRSLELLGWWREELQRCYAGTPRHPVFVALAPVIEKHDLPIDPFDDLIRAFEQDQTVIRYETWNQVIDYCKLSADPVGRLVLMVSGEPRTQELFELSDAVCTALQLTNHWQDVRRDLVERDRIYVPAEMIEPEDFLERMTASVAQGHGVDHRFLAESRAIVKRCVERTWPLFETGERLLPRISDEIRPVIWLFIAGGERVLRKIELWNYETALHRPKLGKLEKLMLVARARFGIMGTPHGTEKTE